MIFVSKFSCRMPVWLVAPQGSVVHHGDVRTVAVVGMVDLDPSGHAVRTVGTVQDISDTKRLEQWLRISDKRFRIAFDDAPLGMAITNARHRARVAGDALRGEGGEDLLRRYYSVPPTSHLEWDAPVLEWPQRVASSEVERAGRPSIDSRGAGR
jgi:PAS domain-containing protein